MTPQLLLLVLTAALLHAGWNALVKVGGDPLVRLGLVNIGAGICALPLLFFVALPDSASWPYLGGSLLIHQGYYLFLVLSYRVGDLSHVYPIARGVAPLLVALGAYGFAGERLDGWGVLAVTIICLAILSLAFDGGWRRGITQPVLFALLTGLMIAGYTVCDGIGGRLAGDVFGYIVYLFVLDGIPVALAVWYLRRKRLASALRHSWRPGLLGGALAFTAYGLVIWAMSLTPMTYVSALRETSVIAAAWMGTRLLHEPFGARRVVAAALVAGGVILLQFSRTVA